MAEPARKAPPTDKPAEVVYRRVPALGSEPPASIESFQVRVREIAPAITPLVIGFLLLLALIAVLSLLSVRTMTNVSFQAHDLEEQYTAKKVFEGGLQVKTALDPVLQRAANRALDSRLRDLDKLRGYRKPTENILARGRTMANYSDPGWTRVPAEGDITRALVTGTEGNVVHLRVDKWTGTIDAKGYAWTRRRASDVAREGDIIEVKILKADAKTSRFTGSVEQPPGIEGAVLAVDNHTGQILAMVGGSNFVRSARNSPPPTWSACRCEP